MELQLTANEADLPAWGEGERELVERAKQEREAFALLYRRHCAAVAGYIFRRLGDPHLTEDLVSDVFMTALKYLPRYRDRGLPIRAWFFRIATNRVNRFVRRERRRFSRNLEEAAAATLAADHSETGGSAGDHRDGERARLALLTLPPKYQAVIALHYLEGLNIEEVARTIGCRVGTVKSRLSRGREALRQKLMRGSNCHVSRS